MESCFEHKGIPFSGMDPRAGLGRFGEKKNLLFLSGIETPIVDPVA